MSLKINKKIADKYPEAIIDPMTDISDTKMYGTGMWFFTPGKRLLAEELVLREADYVIKMTNMYLNMVSCDASEYRMKMHDKTLEELKAERLKKLREEFD